MKYQYEAVSVTGGRRKFKGVIEAESGEQAILELMKRKLYPTALRSMSQSDLAVANRISNFKRIKNALTPGMKVAVRTPVSSPAPRFRIPWGYIIWGIAILGLLWAVTRV